MPTAAFTTLGCKVNQYETQRILESFEDAGFCIVPFADPADVYVINTCSVTGQAESKSRQTVRRAARQNPGAKVVVTGCAAQMALNLGERLGPADLLVPNPAKLETFRIFSDAFPGIVESAREMPAARKPVQGRTRATVKIQDGCSIRCSYCSIPFTRPKMTSRHWEEVLGEVRSLARRGYREVVLTGVLIGAYGPETGSGGPDFEDLVAILETDSRIERIRISSIETTQVGDRLVAMMKKPATKIVPHLHIPLQSGSTEVLSDMGRPYGEARFLELCRGLASEIPDLAISTDIMVGFPTEAEAEFSETLSVCESLQFARAHVFRFSPRSGTPAERWGDPVSPLEKQERSRRVTEVVGRTQAEFIRKRLGLEVDVLVEEKSRRSGLLRGHTGNYIETEFAGPRELVGEICRVRITGAQATFASGELAAMGAPRRGLSELPVVHNRGKWTASSAR